MIHIACKREGREGGEGGREGGGVLPSLRIHFRQDNRVR